MYIYENELVSRCRYRWIDIYSVTLFYYYVKYDKYKYKIKRKEFYYIKILSFI